MNIKKLSSSARKLDIFFKILQRVIIISMIVVLAVLVVLTIANVVNPDAVIGTQLNILKVGSLSIELAEEQALDNAAILRDMWIYTILGIACAGVITLALSYIRRILAPMAKGSPFHTDTSMYLKKLAYLSLIIGIIQNIGTALETTAAFRTLGFDKLVERGIVRSVTVNYTVELSFVVVFFVLMLMSYIFSYGAELQKLSDETL